MINFVPQATGLKPNGDPDEQLHQALLARKKGQATPGQMLSQAASGTEPIYNKSLGYAKLLSGALGGFMQGQEAKAQAENQQAGADSGEALARTYGMTPEQASRWKGYWLRDPAGAMGLLKQHVERALKPDEKSWGVTGQDLMGKPQYGFINTTQGTIAKPNGAPSIGAPAAPASPIGSGGSPIPAGPPSVGSNPPAPQAAKADDPRREQFTQGGYPANAPLPPPGVDPKTYFEEWSKSQTAGQLPPKSDDVTGLRKEVQGLPSYKNMAQAAPIYRSMYEAAGRDTKAADLNMVYGLGKIMDPGSVVREGEIVLANDTQGLGDRLNGMIKSIQGEGRLRPEARMAIMQEAHGRMGSYKQMFDQDAQQFRGIVERNRMNPADVIPDFGTFDKYEPAGPPVPATLQQDIAASRQGQGAPAEAAPQVAPSMPDGITREMLQAEMLRRQQLGFPRRLPLARFAVQGRLATGEHQDCELIAQHGANDPATFICRRRASSSTAHRRSGSTRAARRAAFTVLRWDMVKPPRFMRRSIAYFK